MQGIARVHFGFAKISPGTCNTLLKQVRIRLPEPVPRCVIEDVDKPAIAEKEIEAPGIAVFIYCQRPVVDSILPT